MRPPRSRKKHVLTKTGARLLLVSVLLTPALALGQSSEIERSQKELSQLEREIKLQEEQYVELGRSEKGILKEIAQLTLELRAKNDVLKKNEQAILQTQNEINRLSKQQQDLSERFLSYNQHLGQILSVMASYGTYEAGLLLFYPGSKIQAIQSARIIDSLTPWLEKNGRRVSDELSTVTSLKTQLREKKLQRAQERSVVLSDLGQVEKLVSSRKKKAQDLSMRRKTLSADIQQNLNRVETLKDLIKQLILRQKGGRTPDGIRTFPKNGKISAPIVGAVVQTYGRESESGYVEKQLTLKGEQNTVVRAPFDGRVYLSESLGSYGRVLFVVHKGSPNFVSAIHGIDSASAQNEQWVLEGDPIGLTSASGEIGYILTREDDFVDPAAWIVIVDERVG